MREVQTVTIANGASLSDAVCVNDLVAIGLQLPAAWTSATVTLQGSMDGTTFVNIHENGANAEYAFTNAAASVGLSLSWETMLPWEWIKVRSGTSGSAVTQGAARTIGVIAAEV